MNRGVLTRLHSAAFHPRGYRERTNTVVSGTNYNRCIKSSLPLRWPCTKPYDPVISYSYNSSFVLLVSHQGSRNDLFIFIHFPCWFRIKCDSLLQGSMRRVWAADLLRFKPYGQTFQSLVQLKNSFISCCLNVQWWCCWFFFQHLGYNTSVVVWIKQLITKNLLYICFSLAVINPLLTPGSPRNPSGTCHLVRCAWTMPTNQQLL